MRRSVLNRRAFQALGPATEKARIWVWIWVRVWGTGNSTCAEERNETE